MGPHERRTLPAAQTPLDKRTFETRGWVVWSVDCYPSFTVWSAMPIGARVAVITDAPDLRTLEREINSYEQDLDAHVRDAREKLDALPADWASAREVQEDLISAIANLARVRVQVE